MDFLRISLFDSLGPSRGQSAREYLVNARTCSRLAKIARGPLSRKLYRLKNANIEAARRTAPDELIILGDRNRYFGLLSVALRTDPDLRVHTHENWLAVA